jgi:hypothetical protein
MRKTVGDGAVVYMEARFFYHVQYKNRFSYIDLVDDAPTVVLDEVDDHFYNAHFDKQGRLYYDVPEDRSD